MSDFTVRLQPTVGGEPVDITGHDFRIVFGTSGGTRRYECGKSGDTLTNCTIDGTAIVCVLDNHHLSKGQLCAWVFDYAPDATYPDGNELTVTPSEIDVTLVTGAGDGSDIDAEVAADISAAVHTAQEAAADAAASADDAGDAAVLARAAQVAAEDAAERAAEVGGYSKSEADALLALKADKATTYTKGEVDDLLLGKAAVGESYTKSESDSRYAKPSDIPAQVQSDWAQSDTTAVDYIKNKPSIPAAQVQSDWGQSDSSAADYIKNKPTIPSALSDLSDDSTHRVVTDAEKTTWGGKADKVAVIDASTTDDPAAITQAIAPNTFYDFGVVDSLTITLTAGESGYLAIYACSFTAASDSTTLTLPATVTGEAPTIAAGHHYELNIMDNVLLYTENDGSSN